MNFNSSTVLLERCVLCPTVSARDAELLSIGFAHSDPWKTLGVSASHLKNYLLRDDTHLQRYLIQVEQQTVGIVCLRYPWLRGAYIELLGLLPDYRNHGIGTELLTWLEQQTNSPNLWLAASEFNHAALHFYQRHGFQIVGTLEALVHPDYNELLLRKRLHF